MINTIVFYFFKKRQVWLLLMTSALILESIALYIQHITLLKPCVLCIYQRCALFGIILTGLFIIMTPSYAIFRIIGLLTWIYSAWQGLFLAKKQNDIHLHPSPFTTCDLFVQFPTWLPLDTWIPSIFYAYGDCTENKWFFLTLDMSQWMIIIFFIYLIIPTIPLILYIIHILSKDKLK
ncbi:disulfide bond formation protein DsbB [Blochmannia endosymbiont of Polyrhachis (Hedomyrma) turneri]|uniref:disulfide bond formation protein DsbB n=1 Tax=Blochmannia endosymbiont of Polyrhachis (Hedomyrma) turneri TaxID=1505596 RepID=UPI00061A652F|nr:disulfide bond formation protein DsbB [Blochmannia endosymbiont of Polyrhachis (Hedomyrma) turneri]AKC60002.1 Disulfide bond formation protein B [Blochmannia endosymbiont of Polyrhachis (Hedomyrma) turneri]